MYVYFATPMNKSESCNFNCIIMFRVFVYGGIVNFGSCITCISA